MKHTLFFFVLTFATLTLSAQRQTFQWQGVQREYIVRTPASHTAVEPIPVLFFLHGLGDNITRCDSEYNFQQLAERFGWLIVVPQARPSDMGGGNMWNANMTLQMGGQTVTPNASVDDAGFLMALLDSLTERYNINRDSVFFTGFSMGGFMSHRMAIEHGDAITACAPVSGMITLPLAGQTPVAPVRLLHIHGTADNVVGYDGHSSAFGGPMQLGISVDSTISYWRIHNGCNPVPEIDTLPDTRNDGLRFVRHSYSGGQADVQHLEVIGGSHTWYANTSRYDVDYIAYIHDFFISGQPSGVGIANPAAAALRVWPNPAADYVNVEVSQASRIVLQDCMGLTILSRDIAPGTTRLNLQQLPNGLYLLHFLDGPAQKLVINHGLNR